MEYLGADGTVIPRESLPAIEGEIKDGCVFEGVFGEQVMYSEEWGGFFLVASENSFLSTPFQQFKLVSYPIEDGEKS